MKAKLYVEPEAEAELEPAPRVLDAPSAQAIACMLPAGGHRPSQRTYFDPKQSRSTRGNSIIR
jgi:hypothetical protein